MTGSFVTPPCSNSLAAEIPALPPAPVFEELPKTGDASFDHAIRVAFLHEGYYSDDPSDPGGPTKYGISLRAAQKMGDLDGDGFLDMDLDGDGDVDADDIRLLTPQQAVDIYRRAYWKEVYNQMPLLCAVKVFDLAINMGPKQAHILLQRSLRANTGRLLTEDGIIGQLTLRATKEAYTPVLLAAIRSEAAGFYRQLAAQRPASRKYLNGWLNRAYY